MHDVLPVAAGAFRRKCDIAVKILVNKAGIVTLEVSVVLNIVLALLAAHIVEVEQVEQRLEEFRRVGLLVEQVLVSVRVGLEYFTAEGVHVQYLYFSVEGVVLVVDVIRLDKYFLRRIRGDGAYLNLLKNTGFWSFAVLKWFRGELHQVRPHRLKVPQGLESGVQEAVEVPAGVHEPEFTGVLG